MRSGKEAFCLANTDAVDYTIPYAKWRPENTDLSSSCGQNTAVAVREVLDIGNGDTYSQDRPGQSFDVTDLPNGTYYIEVKANAAKKLSEASTSNNVAYRKVKISGRSGHRKVKAAQVGIIKEPRYTDESEAAGRCKASGLSVGSHSLGDPSRSSTSNSAPASTGVDWPASSLSM